MAKTEHKQDCPTCRQSANMREEKLSAEMMQTLWRVWLYCKEKKTDEFKTSEVGSLVHRTVYANFAKLRFFDVGVVMEKSGSYRILPNRLREVFFDGQEFRHVVLIDPLHAMKGGARMKPIAFGTLAELPNLSDMLDEDGEYVVQYRNHAQPDGQQQTMF